MERLKDTKKPVISAERFAEIVDAYGADPSRWPESERDPALAFLRENTDAQTLVRRSAALDNELDVAASVPVSIALHKRLLGDFDAAVIRRRASPIASIRRATERVRDIVWPGAPMWKPAAALTLSLFVGCAAGLFVPQEVSARNANDAGMITVGDYPQAFELDPADQ